MRRRLFNLAAALSLVLCVAVAGLWVHSAFRAVWCGYGGSRNADGFTREWEVGSTQGRVCWQLVWCWSTSSPAYAGSYVRGEPTVPIGWRWAPASTQYDYGARGSQKGYYAAGFFAERFRAPRVAWDRRFVAVPDWFLMAVFLVLPVAWWRKKRKPGPGCCARCGYDLRATTLSGVWCGGCARHCRMTVPADRMGRGPSGFAAGIILPVPGASRYPPARSPRGIAVRHVISRGVQTDHE